MRGQIRDTAYAALRLSIDNLDQGQVTSLLNEEHSVKDWFSAFESLLAVHQVDIQGFETLKNCVMVDLTGGITPQKRSRYPENVLDETMAWGV